MPPDTVFTRFEIFDAAQVGRLVLNPAADVSTWRTVCGSSKWRRWEAYGVETNKCEWVLDTAQSEGGVKMVRRTTHGLKNLERIGKTVVTS